MGRQGKPSSRSSSKWWLCARGTQVDGESHVVHSEEEALGTRLTIDSLTCLLANETDPSRLQAISPGKLMRYLVPDGTRVLPDQPYAEIEVSPATIVAALQQ